MSKPSWRFIASCMLLVACGDDGKTEEGPSNPDAATSEDASVRRDAGDAASSAREDAASETAADARVATDGGQAADAGSKPDFDQSLSCSPGSYVPASEFAKKSSPNHASNCFDAKYTAAGQAGVFTVPRGSTSIRTIELAVPTTAGQPYSTSYEYEFMGEAGERKLELWGTNAECGQGSTAALLTTTPVLVGKNVICFDMTAAKAYSHLLLVYRLVNDEAPQESATFLLGGATFCAAGTCPAL